jgi:hypothetical protein
MSLQEDLKARTLALISQQMANWVVEIQNNIRQHQANLVGALDDLQETVARYDERINEADIEMAMVEVVDSQPPAAPAAAPGPGVDRLKASIAEIEKGSNLSEVLTYLINEVAQYVDRAAMFIVKGPSAIGWYGRGFDQADAVKQVNVPLSADTVFRIVQNSRHGLRGHVSHSPGTAHALARLGGRPQGVMAVPLVLREKLAAVLYCDSQQEEIPGADADAVEILVTFASKIIDLLSVLPKPTAPAARTTTSGTTVERAAAIRAGGDEVRERAGVPRSAAAPTPPPSSDEGSSTVMFTRDQIAGMGSTGTPRAAPRPAPPPPPPAAPALSPEETKAHDDAKRFARLVVSEIKLYNEAKVNEGRRHKDLYERLKDDVERGRQMYQDRVSSQVRDHANYFYDELVRILAGGDASALGPM